MATKILAGVGTDLFKKCDEAERDKEYNCYALVDPCINMTKPVPEKVLRFCMPFETFLTNQLLENPKIFNGCTIESDRMVEHIDLGTLVSQIFPLLVNILNTFEVRTCSLTFPDLDRIHDFLNSMPDDISLHHLVNIEVIAFGDHKVVLTKRLLSNYLKSNGIDIRYEPITFDNKPFYTKANLVSLCKTGTVPITFKAIEWLSSNNLSDDLWQLSNSIMLKESPSSIYYFKYVSKDKLDTIKQPEILRLINTRRSEIVLDDSDVKRLFMLEGYFKVYEDEPCNPANWFNRVHPYMNVIVFEKKDLL